MLDRIIKGTITALVFTLIGGVAAFKITMNVRENAERALKNEEFVQIAVNNFIISGQKAREDFERERERRRTEGAVELLSRYK